ncbi:unnamed protein product, partial [Medioppia subpectinata]
MLKSLIFILMIMIIVMNGTNGESEGISLLKQKKAQKTNKNRSRAQSRASGTSTAFWPNGVVYYQIDNSLCMLHTDGSLQMLCEAYSPALALGDGCYSSVGKVGGRQYLSLGNGCHDIGSAMHEILHALGWGDVGFHGSHQVKTPNIDLLAGSGILLNNYYVSPICSPSRSAILTGYHPIHTGLQHDVFNGAEPFGTPLQYKLLPQHLKDLGYETHAVGKWHQGFFTKDYIPTQRGFDSHFGYWTGHEDYYDRTSMENWWGIDFRDNEKPANLTEYEGIYSTDIYTNKAIDIINGRCNSTKPLFLYLAHQSVHAGNIMDSLQAPQQYIDRFKYIEDYRRRTFVAMVSALDDSVGEVFSALQKANILNDTIIIFTTDNGGATGGTAGWSIDDSIGSNWPLRGAKYTLWEGGIRGIAFIWSPFLRKTYISDHLMHVTDWLPTIYSAVGGKTQDLGPIDGIDMWNILNNNLQNPRKSLLHNIDPIWDVWALRYGDYKLISGTVYNGDFDGWFLPPGEANETTTVENLVVSQNLQINYRKSKVYKTLKRLNFDSIRVKDIVLKCNSSLMTDCEPTITPCLFNIKSDPCEYHNIYQQNPDIVKTMLNVLNTYNASAVPPGNQPVDNDANPVYHNYIIGWGDVGFHGSHQVKTPNIDLLAGSGIILNNYYVSPICSPSRSAILTGYHPIHTGQQHDALGAADPRGIPLQYKLLPQHLKDLGYETHAVGKWHQGHFKRDYIPTQRGFDSHFGYWTGHEDYYDRTAVENWWGIDFRDNEKPANLTDYEGIYATDIYTNKAIDIINGRSNLTKPLFLYLAHQSVHSGNTRQPLQAPQQYIDRFKDIKDMRRRTFAAMVSTLDDSVGDVFSALQKANILNDTIIIFTADNGAATGDTAGMFDDSIGSNWPLRGAKYTLFEGGIRGTAFIWSPLLRQTYISDHLMHVTDWLPTIYSAVGGQTEDLGPIDGIDMWNILNDNSQNPRKHLLHNIDRDNHMDVWALRYGDYKLISGTVFGGRLDGWYLPPGEVNETNDNNYVTHQSLQKHYLNSKVYQTLKRLNVDSIEVKEIIVKCNASLKTDCKPTVNPCLFNIRSDPCEYNNIYQKNPDIVKTMLNILHIYNASAVPPGNQPEEDKANPIYHNYMWDIWR